MNHSKCRDDVRTLQLHGSEVSSSKQWWWWQQRQHGTSSHTTTTMGVKKKQQQQDPTLVRFHGHRLRTAFLTDPTRRNSCDWPPNNWKLDQPTQSRSNDVFTSTPARGPSTEISKQVELTGHSGRETGFIHISLTPFYVPTRRTAAISTTIAT
ncbi:hypothetical protein Btru_012437 [Bulinus truncatus]|nr:hypothetical protein Btru_012437 [Bulinus truncatus]